MDSIVSPVCVCVCVCVCGLNACMLLLYSCHPGVAQRAWIVHESNGHTLLRGLTLSLSCVFRS